MDKTSRGTWVGFKEELWLFIEIIAIAIAVILTPFALAKESASQVSNFAQQLHGHEIVDITDENGISSTYTVGADAPDPLPEIVVLDDGTMVEIPRFSHKEARGLPDTYKVEFPDKYSIVVTVPLNL